ncbi:MAG: thioredoxin domain-containing protein [Halobacteriovoraceae bacterium]|nr:thioredoxin domain-containing protein [Halobacteriovoraceae bacterium]
MKFFTNIVLLIFLAVFVVSCQTNQSFKKQLKETLAEDPTLVSELIKEHPEQFIEAFQSAAMKMQQVQRDTQKENLLKSIEYYAKNPLKPNIRKNEAIRGNINAPITIVKYSDFQCGYCAKSYHTIKAILEKYPQKVRFVYKHLPLEFHELAMPAAKYFEALRMQSDELAFKFHDKLFEEMRSAEKGQKYFNKIAKELGADLNKLNKDLSSKQLLIRINEDIEEAKKFEIQGTPGFIVNGIPLKGAYPQEIFEQIIQKFI